MTKNWKVVDSEGNDVMTVDSVLSAARRERKPPREVAQREARLLVNVAAGDAPVFAVKV